MGEAGGHTTACAEEDGGVRARAEEDDGEDGGSRRAEEEDRRKPVGSWQVRMEKRKLGEAREGSCTVMRLECIQQLDVILSG